MKSQDYIAVTHRGRYRRGKAEGGTIADDCDGGSLCSFSFSGIMMDPEELRNLTCIFTHTLTHVLHVQSDM